MQIKGNEVLASHVVKGTVSLKTTAEGRMAFNKLFPKLRSKLCFP
jgi:hypothetical protein